MKTMQKKRKRGIFRIVFLIFALIFCYWSNNSIQISEYTYTSDQIPSSFNGYRIVQISDLHNDVFFRKDSSLLKKIEALSPDCIVLTGDIFDNSYHQNIDDALIFTEQVTKLAKTYYVTGNHEDTSKKEIKKRFTDEIQKDGVVYLCSQSADLYSENGDSILLIGIEDKDLQSDKLKKIITDRNKEEFRILLAHKPQFLKDYAEADVDIVFSGHAHGGQFRIPFTHQGLYAPDQGILPQYTEGVFTEGDTSMYISRGIGNSGFPLRLFNRPEIVCVTLQSQ